MRVPAMAESDFLIADNTRRSAARAAILTELQSYIFAADIIMTCRFVSVLSYFPLGRGEFAKEAISQRPSLLTSVTLFRF